MSENEEHIEVLSEQHTTRAWYDAFKEINKTWLTIFGTVAGGVIIAVITIAWNNAVPSKVQKQIDVIEAKVMKTDDKLDSFNTFKNVTEAKDNARDARESRMEDKLDKLIDKLIK